MIPLPQSPVMAEELALPDSRPLIKPLLASGCFPHRTAATPVTWAAEMLVPLSTITPPRAPMDKIWSPGATTSSSSPVELISVTTFSEFVAPTDSTSSKAAGYSIVDSSSAALPAFPADAMMRILFRCALCTASSSSSE